MKKKAKKKSKKVQKPARAAPKQTHALRHYTKLEKWQGEAKKFNGKTRLKTVVKVSDYDAQHYEATLNNQVLGFFNLGTHHGKKFSHGNLYLPKEK